jgi:hypothetical protein
MYFILEIEGDKLINDVYLYIGAFVIFVVILYGIIEMIRKCIKYYKKDEQSML